MALVSMNAPRDGNGKRSTADGNEGGNDLETKPLFGNELETKTFRPRERGNEGTLPDAFPKSLA